MRFHPLLASFVPALLLLSASDAHAAQESQAIAQDEASFGTTPARSKAQMQGQPRPQAAPSTPAGASMPAASDDGVGGQPVFDGGVDE